MNDKKISERLKILREEKKYSQAQLAIQLDRYIPLLEKKRNGKKKKLNLKYENGKQTISQLENNGRKLTIELAYAYSKVFAVSLEYLYSFTDERFPDSKNIGERTGLDGRALSTLDRLKYCSTPDNRMHYLFDPSSFKAPDASLRYEVVNLLLGNRGFLLKTAETLFNIALLKNLYKKENNIFDKKLTTDLSYMFPQDDYTPTYNIHFESMDNQQIEEKIKYDTYYLVESFRNFIESTSEYLCDDFNKNRDEKYNWTNYL